MNSPYNLLKLALAALFSVLLLVSGPAAAQTVPQVAPKPVATAVAAPAPLTEGYVLGPGDVVDIMVLGREEFRPRVQVQTDGSVQLPYLHSVMASNLTVLQLRERVTKLLRDGGYYVDPVVSVAVVSYASRYVIVLGEVGTPGLVPVDRTYRVSEILARVGGVRDSAGDELILRRDYEEFHLPLDKIASAGPADDPQVRPGDKIYVAPAPNFYIYGQVTAPGSYKVERGMSIRMALARGGGLTDRGSANRISVFRGGKKIKVILDQPIQGGDTVVIGERFF